MCGIIKRDYLPASDIGFAFLPSYHGQGYALEVAEATLSFAKSHLSIPVISAITLPENERSIQLLEKVGLMYVNIISVPNSHEKLQLYSN